MRNRDNEHFSVKGAGLLLGLLVVFLYARTILGGFIYDDEYYVKDNPAIRTLFNLPRFFTDPSTGINHALQERMIYRPAATTFYAVEYALFGDLKPGRYHIASIVLFLTLIGMIHALGILLFQGDLRPALFAAAFTAVHPLASETVSWISAQPTLLSALFLVSGLFFHRVGMTLSEGNRRFTLVVAATLFVLSMLTKETGVVAPFVVLACDRFFPKDTDRACTRRIVAVTGIAAVAFLVIRTLLTGQIAQTSGFADGFSGQIAAALAVIPRYLQRFFIPVDLRVFYDLPNSNAINLLIGAVFLLALPILAIRLKNRLPAAAFGLMFCWLTYLPSSNLLPTGMPTAERYFFLPLIGLALAAADWSRPILRGRWISLTVPALIAAGCVLSFLTFHRTFDWSSPIRFWQRAIEEQPHLALGYYNLGLAAARQDRPELAEENYRMALKINPRHADAANNLGTTLARQKRFDEAEHYLKMAVEIDGDMTAVENLVRMYLQQNRQDAVVELIAERTERSPSPSLVRLKQALLHSDALDDGHKNVLHENARIDGSEKD